MYSDSQLVVQQVLDEYEAKKESMLKFLSKVKQLVEVFDTFRSKGYLSLKISMLTPFQN